MTGIVCALPGIIKPAAAAPVARTAVPITAFGNAQVSTAQSKFGGASFFTNTTNGGTASYLNGVWNNATVQTITNMPNYTNYTVEFWLRVPSSPGFTNLQDGDTPASVCIGLQNAIDYPFSWSFGVMNSAKVRFAYLYNSSYSNYGFIESSTTLAANTWYHLAFVKTGTGIKIYIDGTERASGTLTGTMWIQNHGLNMGSYYRARPSIYMDEIRISSTNRYTANFTAPTAAFTNDSNTLLLLHADGTNNQTVFTDDTGVRSPKGIQAIGNAQVDTAQSKFGGASALFDGSGDYLTVNPVGTDLYFPAGQDVTIEMFIRPNITQQFNPFFALGNARGASSGEVSLYIESFGGQFFLRMAYNFGAVLALTSAGGAVASNNWYHVAYTREGDVHRLFLDGALQETETDAGLNLGVSGQGFKVGSWADASGFYTGHIDEIRVSNIARYTAAFTAPTAAFTNDADTLLLIHANGVDAITRFTDDNS